MFAQGVSSDEAVISTDFEDVLGRRKDRICAYTEYRHVFPLQCCCLTPPHALHHAFMVLEVETTDCNEVAIMCVEKFNDALEVSWGAHDDVRQYVMAFRATGDPRAVSSFRPIIAEPRFSLGEEHGFPNVTVGDLVTYVDGDVSEKWRPYCLRTANCQHFAMDLQHFLTTGRQKIHDRKHMLNMLSRSVDRNVMPIQSAEAELSSDREIGLAAVRENGNALCFLSDSLKKDMGIVMEAVDQNPNAFFHADPVLQGDPHLRKMAGLP